jgi:hypothetical protein
MGFTGHPGEVVNALCPATHQTLAASPDNQQSVMNRSLIGLAGRTLRAWDKHRLAKLYGHRNNSSLNERELQGSIWAAETVQLAVPSRVQHRPGASQGGTTVFLEWFDRVSTGFTRGLKKVKWFGGFYSNATEYFSPDRTYQAETPGAVAVDPANNRAIAVFQKRIGSQQYATGSEVYFICYRLSTTGGQSFGGETCTSQGSRRYGVSAGFDPVSSRFIISYASDPDESLVFITLPSQGGVLVFTTLQNNKSWHGASIACRNVASGCRFVYRDRDTDAVKWVEAGVTTAGAITLQPLTRTLGYFTDEMPSVAWYATDQTYRLAIRQGHGAIYSYKMTVTGTAWTGTGDIINGWIVSVSAPVLSTATSVLSTFLFAWGYVKW